MEAAASAPPPADDDAPFFVEATPSVATPPTTRRSARTAASAPTNGAAWHDPYVVAAVVDVAGGARRTRKLRETADDADIAGGDYEARLRARFAATHAGKDAWVASAREAGGSVLASGAPIVANAAAPVSHATPRTALPTGRIHVSRLPDVPGGGDAVVRAVDFHPGGQLLLAAGMDGRVRFAAPTTGGGADSTPVLQSFFLRDMPVRCAAFAAGGRLAIATGRRRFMYVFDLGAGRADRLAPPVGREERSFESFSACPSGDTLALLGDRGALPLLSLRTVCAAGELRVAGTVRAAAWDPSGTYLYAGGGDGVVSTFDIRTRTCVHRTADDGGLGIVALAASGGPDAGMLAVGSASGVVTVYERRRGGLVGRADTGADAPAPAPRTPRAPARPPPTRTLLNLTTAADTLAWAPRGELLIAASRMSRDAARVISGSDLTAYANWPSSRTPLGHVHCVAVSPGGGLLAFGNAKGATLLYRVHHLPIV